MADRGGTIEWKLSAHKVFAGMIGFPDQLGRRLKCAPTSIDRSVTSAIMSTQNAAPIFHA
jgi:hypothetical protein